MELTFSKGIVDISDFRNLSNNEGYDNQPSFYDNNSIVFAYTRNGNTDIMIASIHSKILASHFRPTEGGEYSPQLIPGNQKISAVRLDKDGTQRLYEYTPGQEIAKVVVEDLQVAYYKYYGPNEILTSVLSDDRLDLVLANLKTTRVDTLVENSGRSIHTIPNAEEMSYTIVNDEGNYDIYRLDMLTHESFFVAQLPIGIQDHIWLNNSKLLCGSSDKLYLYDLLGSGDWMEVADLSVYRIKDITRLAISPDGTKLALVAEPVSEIRK